MDRKLSKWASSLSVCVYSAFVYCAVKLANLLPVMAPSKAEEEAGKSFGMPAVFHGGFWMFDDDWLRGRIAARQHMVARDDDILVVSCPKSGTTWLKSLVFAVVRRGAHPPTDPTHPLRRTNPHDCVQFLEEIYAQNRESDLEALPSPRILSTHTPFSILPASVAGSGCRIVYICRNPKDVFVSYWHFRQKIGIHGDQDNTITMDRVFDLFCEGIYPFGPYWDHALEFWNEHLRRPEKVFFVRYEEMKEDPAGNLRKLAAFLGRPFSEEEERGGTVGEILELCSFRSLKEMEVNGEGNLLRTMKTVRVRTNSFFRRGEVGDWEKHFSLEMAAKLDGVIQEKLQGTGLKL